MDYGMIVFNVRKNSELRNLEWYNLNEKEWDFSYESEKEQEFFR